MAKKQKRVAVVGCGHWGRNHIRVFDTLRDSQLVAICDSNPELLATFEGQYPRAQLFTDYRQMVDGGICDALVVATIASTHYEIVKYALENGVDVLAEKPLTLTVPEADDLVRIADDNERVLMVGHTFLFNPSVRKVKEYLDDEEQPVGDVYYMKARRTHLGLIREDVNVVWDLAPHDISMFMYFLGQKPTHVQAMGGNFLKATREDTVFVNLTFPGGVIASLIVSWADSNKERLLDIVGSKARIAFDDLELLEPVRIFYKGVALDEYSDTFGEFKYLLRDGDILSPKIKPEEPLRVMCQAFLDSIETRVVELSDGRFSRDVVEVLVQIEETLLGLRGEYNREQFFTKVAEEAARARRHGRTLSLILFDVDNLRELNATHGKHFGDRVLKQIAIACSDHVRAEQTVSRIGGGEFGLICPETELDGAGVLSSRLQRVIADLALGGASMSPPVSCSFGAAELDESVLDGAELYRLASRALHRAKESGASGLAVHRADVAV